MENQYKTTVKYGDVVKHKNFMDIACLVSSIDNSGNALVSYLNLGYVASWFLPVSPQTVKIDSDWQLCLNPELKCLRYAVWRNL